VRPRTLGWSVLWQSAVAVGAGVLVATVAGVVLGAILLRIVTIPVRFDTGAIAITLGGAVAVVLAVTAAGLPVLHRLMRPEGLRTE
jgi:hypothetical protein